MEQHIAIYHKGLLEYFQKGWEVLSEAMKQKFLYSFVSNVNGPTQYPGTIPGIIPPGLHGPPIPNAGLGMLPQLPHIPGSVSGQSIPPIWVSWTIFSLTEFRPTNFPQHQAIKYVKENMEY